MRRLVLAMHDSRPVWAIPDSAVERIQAALPSDWEVEVNDDPVDGHGDGAGLSRSLLQSIHGAEVYLGIGFPRSLFIEAETVSPGTLRWVHTGTAGVRSLLFEEMLASDVVLTNSAGIHAPTIAETVLGMMLYFARGFDFAVHAQHAHHWDTSPFDKRATVVRELHGSTVGIVGFGGIGREVAQRATALGMRCIAYRRRADIAPGVDGVETVAGRAGLHDLLARSDYVVIAAAATNETECLIAARELSAMQKHAVLINVARGRIVDEGALVGALAGHELRGAGLDVFWTEPLPPDSPLWRMKNVLITPHVSAVSPAYWQRELELILDNIRRYLNGSPLRNVVDKQAGY